MSRLARLISLPTAASTFAGCLGAGVVEVALLLAGGAPLGASLALALGLWGFVGLLLGAFLGLAASVVTHHLPGGPLGLRTTPDLDRRVAAGILAVATGVGAMAVLMAAGHAAVVAPMHSPRLALIATAGLTLIFSIPAGLAALTIYPLLSRFLARRAPLRQLGHTGGILVGLAVAGVLGFIAALGSADWRALDLGPLRSLVIVKLLGLAHAYFYYRSAVGRRVHQRLPLGAIRLAAPLVAVGLLIVARGLPESSPVFAAVEQRSWSLRLGLRLARTLTDGDRDGYSARFGGGDCDDGDPDTYPGAVDTPGDGVDQNCMAGDAPSEATEGPAPAPGTAAPAAARREGAAFDGNILLVTIDSLRADRLGVAGYTRRHDRSLTPTLDALAKRGAYFKRAWAQAPNTPRSFPSLLTGRYPSDIIWTQRSSNYSPLAAENETFFEALATTGRKPIGIFSHFYFTADRGLSQSFAEWSNDGAGTVSESNKDIAAPRIVPRVIARLEAAAKRSNERFVLWTHLFEPHSSYMAHEGFPTNLHGIEGLEEKYDYEIAFVDGWIGKLVASLEATGLAGKTAIVVAADHGEAWGEHRQYFHGTDLTEEQLRVPLIIVVPGKAPRVVDEPVALVDLAPTLLDLVGLAPLPSFRGRSLLPALDGGKLDPRPIFAELLPAPAWPKHEIMVVDGGKKLTHKISERRFELHDLAADPLQKREVSREPAHAAALQALKQRLLEFEEGRR